MLVFFAIFCGNSASVAAARAGKSVVQFLWLRRAAPGILGLFAENQWKCLSLNNLRASPRFRRQNPVKPSQTQSNRVKVGQTRPIQCGIMPRKNTRNAMTSTYEVFLCGLCVLLWPSHLWLRPAALRRGGTGDSPVVSGDSPETSLRAGRAARRHRQVACATAGDFAPLR